MGVELSDGRAGGRVGGRKGRQVYGGQKDGHRDMTKLIVAFINVAKALIEQHINCNFVQFRS